MNYPIVYCVSGSPYAWQVLLTLEVKRMNYASRLLEASKGDLKKPEYLALNPRGRVPTLKDGDFVLYESLAIMAYLDRKRPDPPLFGGTAEETARIWRSISEYFSYMDARVSRIVGPLYFGKAGEKADDIRAAATEVHVELERLDQSLRDSRWLGGGDALCAADIAIYPFVKSLARAASKDEAKPLELGILPLESRYRNLAGWMQRVEAVPAMSALIRRTGSSENREFAVA